MKRIAMVSVLLLAACSSSYHKLRGVHDVWYTIAADRVTVLLPAARTNDPAQARDQIMAGAARIAIEHGYTHFVVESLDVQDNVKAYEHHVAATGTSGLQYRSTSETYWPTPNLVMSFPTKETYTQEVAIVGAARPVRTGSTGTSWRSIGRRAAGSAVIRLTTDGKDAVDARELLSDRL